MRKISTDINREKGKLDKFFSKCIGAGRAAEIMRHTPFEQLKAIQSEFPFEYIRFHGIFHEEMGIVKRDVQGKLHYNFQYIDLLFDSLLEIKLRPILELGLMPVALAKDERYVFWWKMNISMPNDIAEWADLVENLARHLTLRYGENEIKKWYFEIWNEPNHRGFFTESTDIEQYFKLYDSAAKAIKAVCADYKVGGPATCSVAWVYETYEHCQKNGVPLDFISTHNYPGKVAFDPDGTRQVYLMDIDAFCEKFRERGAFCHEKGLPFMITEWSASASPRDFVHDCYISAPLILKIIKKCEGYADAMSYWAFTDIFEEPGVPDKPFHGGFGLLNVQSVKKPSYYALSFLGRLGDFELISNDESSYICKNDSQIQILSWNYKHPENQDADNAIYFKRPLPTQKIDDAEIEIAGLSPENAYNITVETVGYKMGDAYNAFLDMGIEKIETKAQCDFLKSASMPQKIELSVSTDENGVLRFSIPQTENQVDFITVNI